MTLKLASDHAVYGFTPASSLTLAPTPLPFNYFLPVTPYTHTTYVHECSFYELRSDLNIIHLSGFQLWMCVRIIKGL